MRAEWRMENWRRRVIREPLPKLLVMLAWKASVGYSFERRRTHCAYAFALACTGIDQGTVISWGVYESLLRNVL